MLLERDTPTIRAVGRRIALTVAPISFIAVAVAGCASSTALTDAAAEASADLTTATDPTCELLSEPQRRSLADTQLGEPNPDLVGGLPVCKWEAPDGTWIQLTSVPAGRWAEQLPGTMEQLSESGLLTAKDTRDFAAARALILSGQEIAPGRACGLYRSVLSVQGRPGGTYFAVNAFPSRDDPQAIIGTICTAGTFTSVVLAGSDLAGSVDETVRVSEALRDAHRQGLNRR